MSGHRLGAGSQNFEVLDDKLLWDLKHNFLTSFSRWGMSTKNQLSHLRNRIQRSSEIIEVWGWWLPFIA